MKAYVLARVTSKEAAKRSMAEFVEIMENCGIPDMEGDAYFVDDMDSVKDAAEVMLTAAKSLTDAKCDMVVVSDLETFSPKERIAVDCASMFIQVGIPVFTICDGTLVAYKSEVKMGHAILRRM